MPRAEALADREIALGTLGHAFQATLQARFGVLRPDCQ